MDEANPKTAAEALRRMADSMAASAPVRVQLSRRKGFRLQDASPNGLPVVNVARPSRWGNPWKITPHKPWPQLPADWHVSHPNAENVLVFLTKKRAVSCAVAAFKHDLEGYLMKLKPEDVRRELRGKNLACWCAPDAECHADVLLEIANR